MALYHYPKYPFRRKQAWHKLDSCWATKEELRDQQGSCFLIQKAFWVRTAASNSERAQGFIHSASSTVDQDRIYWEDGS